MNGVNGANGAHSGFSASKPTRDSRDGESGEFFNRSISARRVRERRVKIGDEKVARVASIPAGIMKRVVASGVLVLALASCGQGESPGPDDGGTSRAPQGGSTAATGGAGGTAAGGTAGSPQGTGPGGTSGESSESTGGTSTTGGSGAGGTSAGGAAMGGSGGGAVGMSGGSANGGGAATGGEATSTGGGSDGGASGGGGSAASGGAEGGAAPGGAAGSAGSGGESQSPPGCGPVTPVPEAVRERLDLDPFYRKHVDANGVPVLASDAPDDEALILACELLNNMLSQRDDVRQELIRRKARFAIIGKNEGTADIPEYGYRNRPQEDIDYINQRARGLGGIVASCGEENILCLQGDRYYNESICVHEFAHTISLYGAYSADDDFEDALKASFDAAVASGILEQTYRGENLQEYWAEGVQDWYGTNASSNPPNGVHNHVNTRAELADYDPTLHALIGTIFPESVDWGDCHVDP